MTVEASATPAPETTPAQASQAATSETEVVTNKAVETASATEATPPELETKEPEAEERKQDKLAPKFAALAKREREVSLREQKAKEVEKTTAAFESAKKAAKDDPLALLEAHGLTYDEVTEFILNDRRPPKDSYVRKLEDRLNEQEKKEKEKEELNKKETEERMIADYRAKQRSELESAKEKFELVNALGYHDDVYETQVLWFQKNNERISTEQAAEMVENYLESTLTKVKDLGKTKKLFGITDTVKDAVQNGEQKPEASRPEPDSVKAKTKTLSNTLTESAGPGSAHLTDEERLRKAAQMLRFRE